MKCSYVQIELPGEDLLEDEFKCQFEVDSDTLLKVDEKHWCAYHCPCEDSKEELTEKGKWSEEEIEKFNSVFFNTITKNSHNPNIISDESGDFRGINFPGHIDFTDKEFQCHSDFSHSIFHKEAWFSNCTFKEDVIFSNVLFKEEAEFYNVRFDNGLSFNNCTFRLIANFVYSKKGGHNDDDERRLIKSLDMSNTTFKSVVAFNNRSFTGSTNFNNCKFYEAPTFFGSELHQETIFPGIEGFLDTKTDNSIQAYRVLKLSMENVRNRVDEGVFFALEQRSIRQSKSWIRRYISFSFVYDVFSGYGISATKPILWLCVVTLFFSIVYPYALNAIDIVHSIEFSMQQIIRPFSIWGIKESAVISNVFPNANTLLVKLTAALQSVLSLSLISLFVLALRWRYKRG